MPHRISQARWKLRRQMRHATVWLQEWGIWLLCGVGLIDFTLHLMAGLSPQLSFYEVIRTFLLDGEASLWDTPDVPVVLRESLWAFRFILPALAGGAILDLVSRMLPEPLRAPLWMYDHTIVVGAGRLGYRVALELVQRGEPVVVVNLNEEGDGLRRLREQEGIFTLIGDAREVGMLERAGIQRAERIVAVTGSDVVNLSVCLLGLDTQKGGNLRAWAHVFDERLEDLPDHLDRGDELSRLGTFSLFREAAHHFGDRCCRDGEWDGAVVAGYGRFGQAMVESLRQMHGEDWPIVVIDRIAKPQDLDDVTYVRGDLLSPRTLERLKPHVDDARHILCVVCTDSDAANLAFALRLRKALPAEDLTVFTRLFEWPTSMQRSATLDGIQPLELWEEAGRAVVDRLMR